MPREHLPFDFDAWASLHRASPEAFERQRQQAVEAFISTASPAHQPRLRGLQFRIDLERARCQTPLAACLRLYQMTLTSLYDHLLPQLQGQSRPGPSSSSTMHAAVIVPFPGGAPSDRPVD